MAEGTRGVSQAGQLKIVKALRNAVFSVAGLAVATTNTKLKTANTVQFRINGKNFSKVAEDNITISGLTNTGAAETCKVRVEVDVAGTVTFVQGGMASVQALAKFPTRSANKATLGWVEIPASHTFGTTALTGYTFVDGDPDLGADVLEA